MLRMFDAYKFWNTIENTENTEKQWSVKQKLFNLIFSVSFMYESTYVYKHIYRATINGNASDVNLGLADLSWRIMSYYCFFSFIILNFWQWA